MISPLVCSECGTIPQSCKCPASVVRSATRPLIPIREWLARRALLRKRGAL